MRSDKICWVMLGPSLPSIAHFSTFPISIPQYILVVLCPVFLIIHCSFPLLGVVLLSSLLYTHVCGGSCLFSSLLYAMPATSAECQQPEAWPVGHFREGISEKNLWRRSVDAVPPRSVLNGGTVPPFNDPLYVDVFPNIVQQMFSSIDVSPPSSAS